MPKRYKPKGEDTRGLKAKAQKAASQAEKDASKRRLKEAKEAAEWHDASAAKRTGRKQAQLDKQRQKAERAALKRELLEQEEKDMVAFVHFFKPLRIFSCVVG